MKFKGLRPRPGGAKFADILILRVPGSFKYIESLLLMGGSFKYAEILLLRGLEVSNFCNPVSQGLLLRGLGALRLVVWELPIR